MVDFRLQSYGATCVTPAISTKAPPIMLIITDAPVHLVRQVVYIL
jgi:hypothetical protein